MSGKGAKGRRAMGSRIGGYTTAARHDPHQYTLPARMAFLKRFWPEDPELPVPERVRRAEAALNAYMLRLARASARAREERGKARGRVRRRKGAAGPGEGGLLTAG